MNQKNLINMIAWAGLSWAGPQSWTAVPAKHWRWEGKSQCRSIPWLWGAFPEDLPGQALQGWVNSRGTLLAARWMLQHNTGPTYAN